MESILVDLIEKVAGVGAAIDAWPAREDAVRRAEAMGALLHSHWPGAALSACVLRQEGEIAASARDETGGSRPDWASAIRDEGMRPINERSPMPPALKLRDHLLVWEDVGYRDRAHGALALAVSEGESAGYEAARGFLAAVGRLLAGRLEVEALERERDALADEAAGEARLADVGEVAAPLAHEFNNFLNALLLHVAVLQYTLPPETHAGLDEVRRQAMGAAELIQYFQNYRRRGQGPQRPADLNRAVRAAAGQAGRLAIRLDLAGGELPLPGSYGDLKRLCLFLLRNAAAAAAAGGGAVVRTSREGGRVVLRVEDAGAPLSPEDVAHLFEPTGPARDGTNSLEMAACRTLARRLQGAVRGEARPEGGAAVVVEWSQGNRE